MKGLILRHRLTLLRELEAQDSGWQSLLPGTGDLREGGDQHPSSARRAEQAPPPRTFCPRWAFCDPVRPTYAGRATCCVQSTISDAKLSRYTVFLTHTHRDNP